MEDQIGIPVESKKVTATIVAEGLIGRTCEVVQTVYNDLNGIRPEAKLSEKGHLKNDM